MFSRADLYRLGRNMKLISMPERIARDGFVQAVDAIFLDLDKLGLHDTRDVARQLQIWRDDVKKHIDQNPALGTLPMSGYKDIRELNGTLHAISDSIYNETSKGQAIVLDQKAIPNALLTLQKDHRLEAHQVALLNETVRCMQTHAYRSAIVVGWALVFDLVRTWFHSNHLDACNTVIQRHQEVGHVAEYEDWFKMKGERQALEVFRDAKGADERPFISRKLFERLASLLHDRNDYAHANFEEADGPRAAGFITTCLTVWNRPPFTVEQQQQPANGNELERTDQAEAAGGSEQRNGSN